MERPAEDALERGGECNGLESGHMPTRASLWAALHEKCDKVVIDVLRATDIGKFPPKRVEEEQ
jgi:hypothetical protein